jgi:hypothetical protein
MRLSLKKTTVSLPQSFKTAFISCNVTRRSVYYTPDVSANVFVYNGRYYTVANGVWSMAPAYNGPWAVMQIGQVPPPVLSVPVEYDNIPPGHGKKKGPPPWAGQGHGPHAKRPKDK